MVIPLWHHGETERDRDILTLYAGRVLSQFSQSVAWKPDGTHAIILIGVMPYDYWP